MRRRLARAGLVGAAGAGLATMAGWCGAMEAQTAGQPITLRVDLTDAPRKILHATERMPVEHAGRMTLVYPKWVPGEHGPTGPIDNLAGLIITAGGQRVKWERDDVDMYSYRITVPAGATQLNIKMDFLATSPNTGFSAGASMVPDPDPSSAWVPATRVTACTTARTMADTARTMETPW